jgi:hypothetical protein
MASQVIYLVSDGETEWEVSGDEWLRTGAEQGFTSFSGPEYSGRRLAASGRAGIVPPVSVPGKAILGSCRDAGVSGTRTTVTPGRQAAAFPLAGGPEYAARNTSE